MTTDNVITTQPIISRTRISDQPPSYEEVISAQPLSDVVENVNTELTSMNIDAVQESATGNVEDEERKRQRRGDDCCFVYDDIDCFTCRGFSNCCLWLVDYTESCCEVCANCLHDCCESNTVEEHNNGGCCDSGDCCGGDSGNNGNDCDCCFD